MSHETDYWFTFQVNLCICTIFATSRKKFLEPIETILSYLNGPYISTSQTKFKKISVVNFGILSIVCMSVALLQPTSVYVE